MALLWPPSFLGGLAVGGMTWPVQKEELLNNGFLGAFTVCGVFFVRTWMLRNETLDLYNRLEKYLEEREEE